MTRANAETLATYRSLIFACTVLTGLSALVFQVTWQRYLSFLLGSESRSVSLVVAMFLLGLATGYRFWGSLTEKIESRSALLKLYGYVELGIATYAVLFPAYFRFVKHLSYAAPIGLFYDSVAAFSLLFAPTFLMGATVPILTTVLPDDMSEVNVCHARVYGWNTLGAFCGAILGGFFFIPHFGLPVALVVASILNVASGAICVFNPLEGEVKRLPGESRLDETLRPRLAYLVAFVVGGISISFEVILVRLFGLAIGSGHYLFPLIVGLYVLGLGLGSLSLKNSGIRPARLTTELSVLSALLIATYLTAPYWPYWLSNVRVSLTSLPSNFPVYMVAVFLLAGLVSLPFVFFFGRVLPLTYALVDKDVSDFGRVCGNLYFFNTAGTVFGTVIWAHYLLNFVNLDQIFKMSIVVLCLGSLLITGSAEVSRRQTCVAAFVLLTVLFVPRWPKEPRALGLFRLQRPNPFNFQGPFRIPEFPGQTVRFLKDGPTATVSVIETKNAEESAQPRRADLSIVVNGKSDSSTEGDYSTVTLLSTISYVHLKQSDRLKVAVIGLGTGITAGVASQITGVDSVDVLEIAREVILADELFQGQNWNILKNPKVSIHEVDGFKFFAKSRQKYDLILSEPSNPWVVGVENLFTPEFYRLVRQNLTAGGIFAQWIQLYEISWDEIAVVLQNLVDQFGFVELYQIHQGDIAVIASRGASAVDPSKFEEPVVSEIHRQLGMASPEDLAVLEAHTDHFIRRAVELFPSRKLLYHNLENPRLGLAAGRARFADASTDPAAFVDERISRHLFADPTRSVRIGKVLSSRSDVLKRCEPITGRGVSVFCNRAKSMMAAYEAMSDPAASPESRIRGYRTLRNAGIIERDDAFLSRIEEVLLDRDLSKIPRDAVVSKLLIEEYALEREFEKSRAVIRALKANNKISGPGERLLSKLVLDLERFIGEALQGEDAPGRCGESPAPSRGH